MSTDATFFIDIHCHILPGIDDGARDASEAVQMARLAVGSGIGVIAATPHHLPRSAVSAVEEARRRVAALQAMVDRSGVPVRLHPGQENTARRDLAQRVHEAEAVPLNGSGYILVEPPFRSYPAYLDGLLSELQRQGMTPVLAHPERNTHIQKDPDILHRLVEQGVLVQVNTGSFLGHYREAARETVSALLRRNLVHVLATDAHHVRGPRVPNMAEGFRAAAREVGEERAWAITHLNPLAILEGRLLPEIGEPLRRPAALAGRIFGMAQGRQGRLV